MGFTVLIEEGLLMTLHTYMVYFPRLFKTKPKVLPFLANLIGWLANKNQVNIVLDAADQDLNLRRISRSFRRIEHPEYIRSQEEWMGHLSSSNNFIETTRISAKVVHGKVIDVVRNHVGCTW